jgi:heat shock protein HslJ
MQRPTFLFSLALVTAMVCACSFGLGASPAPSLDGKTYLSTDIQGAALVPGSRIQLTFASGDVNANGGCNSISGPYTVAGDRFSVMRMASTAMGCEAPLMEQDQWLVKLLEDAKIALAGDTLTLDNGQVRLTLLDREIASPDKPLVGTHWVLDSILDGDTVSSVPAGVTASMRIANGQLELDAGCNIGGGPVTVAADTLEFGPMMLTKRACQAGPSSVEEAVTTTLSGTVSYTIDSDLLTIDAGGPSLVFRAAP